MGFIQTSLSASQILGLPLGLYLTNLWGWHIPFMMIVGVSILAACAIIFYLKPLKGHLELQEKRNAFEHLLGIVKGPTYLIAFFATGLLSLGGFMIMPFSSAFTIHNLGISGEQLPMIYFVTGICSIVVGPLVGKLSDAYGKLRIFIAGSLISIVMVLIYTHLDVTPLYLVIIVNILLFIGIFSRMIPSQALISAIPSPANRGAFMSVSASLQSLAGGIGSIVAGAIVVQESSGRILHFNVIGYVMTAIALVCLGLMYQINKSVLRKIREEAKA